MSCFHLVSLDHPKAPTIFRKPTSTYGCGSTLTRRGKPQVLVQVSTYQGKPFWISLALLTAPTPPPPASSVAKRRASGDRLPRETCTSDATAAERMGRENADPKVFSISKVYLFGGRSKLSF